MQDLQADLAGLGVHGFRDETMARHFAPRGQLAGERRNPAGAIRRDATGDDQAHPAPCALGEIRSQLRIVLRAILEASVHRAHDQAVAKTVTGELKRGEKLRVAHPRIIAPAPQQIPESFGSMRP